MSDYLMRIVETNGTVFFEDETWSVVRAISRIESLWKYHYKSNDSAATAIVTLKPDGEVMWKNGVYVDKDCKELYEERDKRCKLTEDEINKYSNIRQNRLYGIRGADRLPFSFDLD